MCVTWQAAFADARTEHERAAPAPIGFDADRPQARDCDKIHSCFHRADPLVSGTRKRRCAPGAIVHTNHLIAASPKHDTAPDIIERTLNRARIQTERRAFAHELSLKKNMNDLADDLRGTEDWRAPATPARRLDAAGEYLLAKAEGYRQRPGLVESLMRAQSPSTIAHPGTNFRLMCCCSPRYSGRLFAGGPKPVRSPKIME